MTAQLETLGVEFERVGVDMRTCTDEEILDWVEIHFPHIKFDLGGVAEPRPDVGYRI